MQIFELFMEPITYIRFITQFSPILFSFIAIIDSAYNTSLKGILYVFGVLLTFFIGKLLSASFPYRVPGIEDGMDENAFASSKLESDKYAFKNPKFHPSCNLISKPDHAGWGTFYSSPDMYSLFYSFTIVYIISCMMGNNDLNIFVLTILVFFFILSSYFRTQVFYCVQFRDILIGLIIGSFLGFLWHLFVSISETSLKVYDLTYFNTNKENSDKCAMKNKQFRCKKIKTNSENDEKISQLKIEANQAAMAAMRSLNSINTSENFDMVWQLYLSILKKQLKLNNDDIGVIPLSLKDNNENKNITTQISINNVVGYNIDNYIEKIYGTKDKERNFNESIDSSNNLYLHTNNNDESLYKYYSEQDESFIENSDIPKIKDVLITNYILFKNFIEDYNAARVTDNDKKPLVIKDIKDAMDEEDKYIYPILILKDYLTDIKDYSKISQYILSLS